VLNYVAHLTEYTCTHEEFLGGLGAGPDLRSSIGLAGRSIHCERMQSEPGANYALLYPHPKWKKFVSQSHSWRLAILGVGFDTLLCLVPLTTQKGDLVVAIAPDTLAMVISPVQSDGRIGGLIPPSDPYETITQSSPKVDQVTPIVYDISEVLCGLILGFNIAMTFLKDGSLVGTIVLVCYGATLSLILTNWIANCHMSPWNGSLRRDWIDYGRKLDVPKAHGQANVLGTISFGFALYYTTGQRRMVLAIFYGTTMVAMTIIALRGHWVTFQCHIEMALRRKEVARRLASATDTLGPHCEFKGPVLVTWRLNYFGKFDFIGSDYWPLVKFMSYITRGRSRLGEVNKEWFHSEVCVFERSDQAWLWNGPIQEFKLH
jgi:hypothetical protein